MKIRFMYIIMSLFIVGTSVSCSIEEEELPTQELSTGDEADDPVGPDEDN